MRIKPVKRDEEEQMLQLDRGKRWKEFDCPICNANNPHADGFYTGDIVLCCYCGTELKAIDKGGRLDLIEI